MELARMWGLGSRGELLLEVLLLLCSLFSPPGRLKQLLMWKLRRHKASSSNGLYVNVAVLGDLEARLLRVL
jgi:hypothetical protein